MVIVTTIMGLHVVMIVVHGSFADYVAEFVCINVTMMMIVMDDVGVAVAIDPRDSILFVLMPPRSRTSEDERSNC